MSEKPVVIVISDLHLGGGKEDKGEDHVCDEDQLARFIVDDLLSTDDGARGAIELYVNGDFLEFAQVNQQAYRLASSDAWCSESESMEKLEVILRGHANVFEAMRAFRKAGNGITIAAGNHDVDLFWPAVQRRLREQTGDVDFVLGADWASRFGGRLRIAHGHQHDRANRFEKWSHPFVTGRDGQKRLEMCPGTLFMTKFVNRLEAQYPFADNIKPEGALARLLWREDRLGWVLTGASLLAFSASHPLTTLGTETSKSRLAEMVVDAVRADPEVGAMVCDWYRRYIAADASDSEVEDALLAPERLDALLAAVMAQEDARQWQSAFNRVRVRGGTLGTGEGTLALREAQQQDDKALFRNVARGWLENGDTQVVVLGHTHMPDRMVVDGGQYFNPGSWTRYVSGDALEKMRLDDLRDEHRFPYQLNFVRVDGREPRLRAAMHTYREVPGE